MNLSKGKKAEKTKQNIIRAARALFDDKGIIKASVNDIVKRAGVAKGTFYLYFETKDDVVRAIILESLDPLGRMLQSLPSMPVSKDAIAAFIDRMTEALKERANLLHMMHQARFLSYIGTDFFMEDLIAGFLTPIRIWLDRGVQEGILDIPDTGFFAYYIFTSFHEMIDMQYTGESSWSLDQLGDYMKTILCRILFRK